jgi:DNA-binding response OmpR family regulator
MENKPPKILIVEDDKSLRDVLVDKMSVTEYKVFQAGDGEEAITQLLDLKPDIVLLDLLLPKLDGFAVLERVRHFPDPEISQIPVIILSNLWSNKDILRAQSLQIDEYYVKANTNIDDVLAKVREILRSKSSTPNF